MLSKESDSEAAKNSALGEAGLGGAAPAASRGPQLFLLRLLLLRSLVERILAAATAASILFMEEKERKIHFKEEIFLNVGFDF